MNKENQLIDLLLDLFDDPDQFPNIEITHIELHEDGAPIRLGGILYSTPGSIKYMSLSFKK